ncbi:GFA family protein [Hoeflea alexandrii]
MASKSIHLGGCLCGAIRFEARAPASNPHTCSCQMCQRHTGCPTSVWVDFPKDAVSWTGPGGAPSVYRSSDYSSRAFCQVCGSTLGAIDDQPTIALLVGCFDKPGRSDPVPVAHSYTGSRPKWWGIKVHSK